MCTNSFYELPQCARLSTVTTDSLANPSSGLLKTGTTQFNEAAPEVLGTEQGIGSQGSSILSSSFHLI